MNVGNVYERLNNVPKAIEHYDKCLALLEKAGIRSEAVESLRSSEAKLKATLVPHEVVLPSVRNYSNGELYKDLKRDLTFDETKLLTDPIEITPEMKKWAVELVGGSKTDIERAKRIFEGLRQHVDLFAGNRVRTAREVFIAWPEPKDSFTCQEYSLLYIALARYAGLDVHAVTVDEDYKGIRVIHMCVGLKSGEKGYLIDPAYHWFGVPHKKFSILDDRQLTAVALGQQLDNVGKLKVAIKIDPKCHVARMNLVQMLALGGDLVGAHKEMADAFNLDSNRWEAAFTKGTLARIEGDINSAVLSFQEAVRMNPDYGPLHFFLGMGLYKQGKLIESRDELRRSLENESGNASGLVALDLIAEINQSLLTKAISTK
jgi:tetratricopeptide (TPR) repeat protein